jgi:probable addiction module antidote protein
MAIKLYPFDAASYLKTAEDVEIYLRVALEENDPEFFQEALGTVARSKGMQAIARQSKTTRAGLYKALSAAGNPEFATVVRVVEALGYRLSIDRLVPEKRGRTTVNSDSKKVSKKTGVRKVTARRRRA